MVEEAWLPFTFGPDGYNEKGAATNHSRSPIDSSGFHALIQEIASVAKEMKSEAKNTTVFGSKWKLEIIVQYFQKYIAKNSVQTRRSSGTTNTDNFDGVLKCFSNNSSTRNIIKKISTEVVPLILAYAFQAYLALSYDASEGLSDTMEDDKTTLLCNCDPGAQISSFGKDALFIAATILSTKS